MTESSSTQIPHLKKTKREYLGEWTLSKTTLDYPYTRSSSKGAKPHFIPYLGNITAYNIDYRETESASVLTPLSSKKVTDELVRIFRLANVDDFGEGRLTDFFLSLVDFIDKYKTIAIETIARNLSSDKLDDVVLSEALEIIGQIDDLFTYDRRLSLLEHCLSLPSPRIRYGATLGLSLINDPKAIPYIETAIDKETIDILQNVMKQVLDQLQMVK